jgi:DNA repair photolyase
MSAEGNKKVRPEIKEVQCKSILTKSGISGVDFALNPYVGCEHGCLYCYAKFMKKYTGHAEPWGHFVDIKKNAPQVLEKQLRRIGRRTIMLGTVTDAYQPIEQRTMLTRSLLMQLATKDVHLHIQTKSSLVQRDLHLLTRFSDVEVCFTIITPDDADRAILEPRASPIHDRLRAMEKLASQQVYVNIFIGPLIPFMSKGKIITLLKAVYNCGAKEILWDQLNYVRSNVARLQSALRERYPRFAKTLPYASFDAYYDQAGKLISEFCSSHDIEGIAVE